MAGSIEQYTPELYIEMVREVLGEIDLDPASCDKAQTIVKATHFYTEEYDAMHYKWKGRVFLNPPYSRGAIDQFIDKLIEGCNSFSGVYEYITLTNLASSPKWAQKLITLADSICFPDHRIAFIQEDTMQPKKGNNRDQMFTYCGHNKNKFKEVFSRIGTVK